MKVELIVTEDGLFVPKKDGTYCLIEGAVSVAALTETLLRHGQVGRAKRPYPKGTRKRRAKTAEPTTHAGGEAIGKLARMQDSIAQMDPQRTAPK